MVLMQDRHAPVNCNLNPKFQQGICPFDTLSTITELLLYIRNQEWSVNTAKGLIKEYNRESMKFLELYWNCSLKE
jgi:hypothetical protein